jgi:hypothetical protein
MKKKPATIAINLLPRDPFFNTVPGRVLKWALSAGRYIVIFTELVVIISFATRFTLDRQVTDINEEISQKESIITAYGDLENNFRIVQKKIDVYKQIEQESNIVETFAHLRAVTPEGIVLEELVVRPETITASGRALSQTAFNLLINNLQLSPEFHNVRVDTVESGENENAPGFAFSLRADTRVVTKVTAPTTTTEPVDILDRTGGL